MLSEDLNMTERKSRCHGCGAHVEFTPKAGQLVCPYCGTAQDIPNSDVPIEEIDFADGLEQGFADAPTLEAFTMVCTSCAAETRFDAEQTATRCAFCDAPLVRAEVPKAVLEPQGLLPFGVERREANRAFEKWLKGLWFAPSDLTRMARKDGLNGVYLPYFTYDSETTTQYRGQRGTHYYETHSYTVETPQGRKERTRRVRKTRWSNCSGRVGVDFDDVLVLASTGLPEPLLRRLEPWPLDELISFDAKFLYGFQAECDQLGLEKSFASSKARCVPEIARTIKRDIGGDEQRVIHRETQWRNVTFKHILLPVWVSAFRYNQRLYRVVVNAQTGEVQGQRPWSWLKIGAAAVLVAMIAAIIYYLYSDRL